MEILDPEGVHLDALGRLADFRGKRVLEMGCGDGRLTAAIAPDAARVLAFDPDQGEVSKARESIANDKVTFEVATAEAIEVEPHSFDLVLFSWSL
jgi:2-polyprenyl-3-methyl-5-hydroxy-6-metoxy-1,4-benzoquinol methylase